MKEEVTVEVLVNESNFTVLTMPGRRYPGVLIQGDSLSGLVGELTEAIQLFDVDREESLGCLKLGFDQLKWRLDEYNRGCTENGYTLPIPANPQ